MKSLSIKAPAKINLGLNIIRKRDDGYHDIETFFYPINLFDTLTFYESSNFDFFCDNEELDNESNLIIKGKQLLENELQKKINVRILLNKKIPIGAGLGGGSSDAAAALLGMNKFLNLDIDEETLKRLAVKVGADVPFFLKPISSYAEGIGDVITPMECKLNFPIVLVCPQIRIETKWAYEQASVVEPIYSLKKLIEDCEIDFYFMQNKIKNDFEPIVFRHFPEIEKIKKELYKLGAMFALMSGSGSSVYGIFPNLSKAEHSINIFNKHYFTFLHYENI